MRGTSPTAGGFHLKSSYLIIPSPYHLRPQEKNVGSDALAGKVGRIYMPPQKVDTVALSKMKGLKRERRQATGERKAANAAGLGPKQPRRKIAAAPTGQEED